MIAGAFTPTMPLPLDTATTKPRLAARLYAGAVDAMPLFSYEPPPPEPPHDALREALQALDPDGLSPRDAQAALYELKRLAKEAMK